MLDITMLGTGGGIPIPERYLSSMMINYKGRKILIDAGEGTQVAIREFHTGFRSLDIICLTHFHGDHIFGLPGLLSTLSNSNRVNPVTIIGPTGLKEVIDGFLVSLKYLPFDIHIIENPDKDLYFKIEDEILKLNKGEDTNYDISISTLELKHSSDCLGYNFYLPRRPEFYPERAIRKDIPRDLWSKLQNGETLEKGGKVYKPNMVLGEERKGIKLSFITDTRPIEGIRDFIKDSDLFVCEGTYGDDEDGKRAIENYHMTFREAATLAKEANVRELLLTHFSAALANPEQYKENAVEAFSNTEIGVDGYKFNLNYDD